MKATGTKVTSRTLALTASVREAHEALARLAPFAGLAANTRATMVAAGRVQRYAAHTTLFRAGEPAAGVFIVLSGEVRVLRSRGGRQVVVHTEGPGGTLGEVPMFEGGAFPATAEAVVASCCLVLGRDALTTIMATDADVALLFLRRLASRVRGLVERLDRMSSQSVPSRLAAFLLQRGGATNVAFTLGMSQAALAEELGTVREVVVRHLAQLRATGVIAVVARGRYSIVDRRALDAMAVS